MSSALAPHRHRTNAGKGETLEVAKWAAPKGAPPISQPSARLPRWQRSPAAMPSDAQQCRAAMPSSSDQRGCPAGSPGAPRTQPPPAGQQPQEAPRAPPATPRWSPGRRAPGAGPGAAEFRHRHEPEHRDPHSRGSSLAPSLGPQSPRRDTHRLPRPPAGGGGHDFRVPGRKSNSAGRARVRPYWPRVEVPGPHWLRDDVVPWRSAGLAIGSLLREGGLSARRFLLGGASARGGSSCFPARGDRGSLIRASISTIS